jgi:hypothetical protein
MTLLCFQVEGEGCDATDMRLMFRKSSIEAKRDWANDQGWDGIAGVSAKRMPHWDKHAGTGVPALERIEAGWWYECTGCGTRIDHDIIGTRERYGDSYEDGCLDREYGPDISRPEIEPVEPIHGYVWCHQSCYDWDRARAAKLRRYEERIYAWLLRRLKRRLPGAEALPLPPTDDEYPHCWHAVHGEHKTTSYVYVSSQGRVYAKRNPARPHARLESRTVSWPGVCEASVRFRWPGAKYGESALRIYDDRYNGHPRKAQFEVANGDHAAFQAWYVEQQGEKVDAAHG